MVLFMVMPNTSISNEKKNVEEREKNECNPHLLFPYGFDNLNEIQYP